MPVLKNPRHERFAQLLAIGRTAVDGYEEAGYKRNTGNGPALARTEVN
jgi:phage terminase small subunit